MHSGGRNDATTTRTCLCCMAFAKTMRHLWCVHWQQCVPKFNLTAARGCHSTDFNLTLSVVNYSFRTGGAVRYGQRDVQRGRPHSPTVTLYAACTRVDSPRFGVDFFTCRARPLLVSPRAQSGPAIGFTANWAAGWTTSAYQTRNYNEYVMNYLLHSHTYVKTLHSTRGSTHVSPSSTRASLGSSCTNRGGAAAST